MQTRFHSCLTALLLFGSLAVPAAAQLPDWSALPVDPSSTVQFEQAWVLSQSGNQISAFSCYNRRWSKITTLSASPSITRYNEHFIVQDGTTFWAYSPHTADFYPLVAPSGTASLITTSSPQTWLNAVQDGKKVYVFFPLTGHWNTYTFATTPTVVYRNFCALIYDGTWIYGISAFHESIAPLFDASATITGCFGTVGIATAPGVVYGFSAHQNTWATTPVAAPPTITNGFAANPGFVFVNDGNTLQFFSGATGTFTTVPAPPSASVFLHRQTAVVVDGTLVWGYSGLLGTTTAYQLSAVPTVTMQHYFGIIDDGAFVVVYSAPKGDFSSALPGSPYVFATGQNMAVGSQSGVPKVGYSALTNQWIQAPPLTSAQVVVGGSAAVLIDLLGTGAYGLSVNQSGWIWEPTLTAPSQVYQPNTPQGPSALIVVRQGNELYAFNHATEKWRQTSVTGPVTFSAGHYGSAVFTDAQNAYGFGVSNDRWASLPLNATPTTVAAQVFSGYVREPNRLLAYTALGQTNTTNEYPDYIRNVVVGGLLRVIVSGEPNAATYVLLAEGAADFFLPGVGTLLIDPFTMFVLSAPNLSAIGLASVLVQVPSSPILSGLHLHAQSLVVPSPAELYLTNATDFTIY